LRALVEAAQLRPESILFLDDNPMNLAEAQHHVAGLQVGGVELVSHLLVDPRCQGKRDAALTRLKQYQLLQSRQEARQTRGGDNAAFLRESGITVTIEYDFAPHIDRAIELINRTNQLNFRKQRLSEDINEARRELTELLGRHTSLAGILRVRDRYGDYGYCGLYILNSHGFLMQFCFSCRILNMGVEQWLYQRLNRPALEVIGPVVSDVVGYQGEVDWIALGQGSAADAPAQGAALIDHFLARGGCDILAISHYFRDSAKMIYEEFGAPRGNCFPMLSHSMITRYAIEGISAEGVEQARLFGFVPDDFVTGMRTIPTADRGIWLLSFAHDNAPRLYRSKRTGESFPVSFMKVRGQLKNLLTQDPSVTGIDRKVLEIMRRDFDYVGPISDELFLENFDIIVGAAPANVRVVVLTGNERVLNAAGEPVGAKGMQHRNALVRQAAAGRANVTIMDIAAFLPADAKPGHHFDRMVYYNLYQALLKLALDGEAPR